MTDQMTIDECIAEFEKIGVAYELSPAQLSQFVQGHAWDGRRYWSMDKLIPPMSLWAKRSNPDHLVVVFSTSERYVEGFSAVAGYGRWGCPVGLFLDRHYLISEKTLVSARPA